MKTYIFILIITLISLGAKAQTPKYCTADFSYQVNLEVSPFTFDFTDNSTSSNTIVDWQWDFGNGESSVKQNPEHQYLVEGVYVVSLQITDQLGCTDISIDTIEVVALIPPTCSAFFTYGLDTTASNYTYKFFDHSIHTNDSIISWSWNFGDSSPISHLQHPTHQYSSTGNYTVSLDIVTANNCNSNYNTTLTVTSGGINCNANFTNNIDTISGLANTLLFHDNSLHTGPILSWLWNFGDGDSSYYQDPTHTFPYPGIYTVKLKITTAICTSQIEIPIQVGNPQKYNVWGRVYVGNYTADQCVAYLYKEYQADYVVPIDTVELTSINDTLGIYYFYQIPEGNHRIQVVLPSSSQYSSSYAPTYFINSVLWQHSNSISLFQDLSLQNIHMEAIQPQTGTGFISGKVINEANGQLEGIIVFLYNAQGDVIDYTFTDAQGNYHFNNVPQGDLLVYGDLAGFASYPAGVNFTTTYDSLSQVNFLIKGRSSVGFIENEDEVSELNYKVFPNPLIGNNLFVQFNTAISSDYDYQISNALGSIIQSGIMQKGRDTFTIELNGLRKGFYFIYIIDKTSNTTTFKKLIY